MNVNDINFLKLIKKQIDYFYKFIVIMNVIITGSVGCGKSTLINRIIPIFDKQEFKYYYFPEFLHKDDFAHELVKKKFCNEISALTFQSYIMDKWLKMVKEFKPKESTFDIKLFERLPEDAVEVFAKLSLDEIELKTQVLKLIRINDILNVSYYKMNEIDTVWIYYVNDFKEHNEEYNKFKMSYLIGLIIKLIKSENYKNIVVEMFSPSNLSNTMDIRKRDGEIYTNNSMSRLNDYYKKYLNNIRLNIKCETLKLL